MSRIALGSLFFLVFLTPLSATAGDAASDSLPPDLASMNDTGLFVLGNVLFAIYHEFGHALIDLLDLPVVGREEDAADGFAAIRMIPPAPDPLRDELIIAVADGWRLQGEAVVGRFDRQSLWDEHALDEQRHYTMVCLLVGSDQEGFFDYARDAGLPVERIVTCPEDFLAMQAGWRRLLSGYTLDRAGGDSSDHGRIDLVFGEPAPGDRGGFDLARAGGVVERAVAGLARDIALPEDVTVRFASCDRANAHWIRATREVLICYALVSEFRSLLDGMPGR